MALIVKDRVQQTSSTTGTGTLTLGSSVTGFQTFSSAIGNTNTTYYALENSDVPTEWEVGIGTVSAGQLSRDTVLESSNSGSLVNFSAGTKNVFCTYPAEKSVDIETAQTLTNKTISGSSNTLSNIANSSLTNSSITINGTSVSLGGSISVSGVSSVGLTLPTGLTVTGSPITSSGTFSVTFTAGYSIPTDAKQSNWDTAYSWGNHATSGYLTSINGSMVTSALGFTPYNSTNPAGYISGYTETDPVFVAHPAYGVTGTKITNWDTAYSWGNHASAGYLTGVSWGIITGTVPTWNQNTTGSAATLTTPRTINGVNFDGSANITIKASTTNVLTAGSGISFSSGTTFDGSAALTISATGGGGGGISSADIQDFTSTGTSTWTKPAGAKLVQIVCIGAGGGGGSGYKAPPTPTDAAISGGAGGHCGGWATVTIPAALLGSTETITVGVGGTGAASRTTTGSNNGGVGGNSSFGSWCVARGGQLTSGGTTGTSGGGSGQGPSSSFLAFSLSTTLLTGNGAGATRGLAGSNGSVGGFQGGGGGSGGGIVHATNAALAGGPGGLGGAATKAVSSTVGGGGTQGTSGSPNASNGTNSTNNFLGGNGGGGGASQITANSGNGGNGGYPGGGGGGSGACLNAYNTGTGGNGGDGYVLVITYF